MVMCEKIKPLRKYLIAIGVVTLWAVFSYAYLGVEDGSSGLSILGWVQGLFFFPGGFLFHAIKESYSNTDLPVMAGISWFVYVLVILLVVNYVCVIRKRISQSRPIPLGRYYLFVWLSLGIILLCWHIGNWSVNMKPQTKICAGFANLFGPWATIIVKASDFPNAGGSFNLPFTLICTAVLAIIIIVPLLIKQIRLQILCAILFIPLILFWLVSGWIQLASCAT